MGAGLPALLAGTAQAQTVVRYVHTDALGSVVAITDQNRVVIERREYEPYGQQLTPTVQDGPGYTGHVQDAATGLTYMQERYFDPQVGRFLSVDPVEADSSSGDLFNRYMYAANNPYTFFDPDGRCTGSRLENGDGTCQSTGDFTTQGGGPTMPGAQTVVHQASIEAQAKLNSRTAYAGEEDIFDQLGPTPDEVAAYDAWYSKNSNKSPPDDFLNSCEGDVACRQLDQYIKLMMKGPETALEYIATRGALKLMARPGGLRGLCLSAGIAAASCNGKSLDILEDVLKRQREAKSTSEAMKMESRVRAEQKLQSVP